MFCSLNVHNLLIHIFICTFFAIIRNPAACLKVSIAIISFIYLIQVKARFRAEVYAINDYLKEIESRKFREEEEREKKEKSDLAKSYIECVDAADLCETDSSDSDSSDGEVELTPSATVSSRYNSKGRRDDKSITGIIQATLSNTIKSRGGGGIICSDSPGDGFTSGANSILDVKQGSKIKAKLKTSHYGGV